jgi:hypothetical protein
MSPMRQHHHELGHTLGMKPGDRVVPARQFTCRRPTPIARLALALAALQVGDIVTTGLVLHTGAGVEGNGATALLVNLGLFGLIAMLVIKLAVVTLIYRRGTIKPSTSRLRAGWAVACLYAVVLGWNIAVLVAR